jgi:hypothetical protein
MLGRDDQKRTMGSQRDPHPPRALEGRGASGLKMAAPPTISLAALFGFRHESADARRVQEFEAAVM